MSEQEAPLQSLQKVKVFKLSTPQFSARRNENDVTARRIVINNLSDAVMTTRSQKSVFLAGLERLMKYSSDLLRRLTGRTNDERTGKEAESELKDAMSSGKFNQAFIAPEVGSPCRRR
jgi:hypothetical protein